jgi:Asp-tRNA(Asn)/Glu-tRNA(Gln) amidotransferase C subunit
MSEGNQNSKAQKTARLKEIDKELQRIEKDMENIPAQIKSLEDELHEPYEPTVKEIKKIATTIEDDDNKKRSDKAKQALKRKKMLRNQKAARLKEIFDEQERIKKLMSDIPARINSLQAESRKWDEPIGLKEQDISELRTQISELKVHEDAKDDRFNINNSRDEHGHIFLMVSAENNDIDMATLCFELKADPNVTNHQGLTAMSFAFFFKFQAMVDLIAANGGTYPTHQEDAWRGIMSAGTRQVQNVID